jgi:hypothetical protein
MDAGLRHPVRDSFAVPCYASLMLRRAQTLLNKVGLLAALLFALVAVLPATAAVVCADEAPASASAATAAPASAPCEDPACEHCAVVCGHGCCHAPHAASPRTDAPALTLPTTTHDALGWVSSPGAPVQAADGLERPPRV